MLVGSSGENPRLVTEVQAPAQHTAPVRVPVVVVVDDSGETQRHVAEKRCVLHHMGVSCREETTERQGAECEEMEQEDILICKIHVCIENTEHEEGRINLERRLKLKLKIFRRELI